MLSSRLRAGALGALLCGALVAGLPPASASDDLEGRKSTVDAKVDKAEARLERTKAAVAAATDALLRARSDLVRAQAYLTQTRAELAAAEALDREMQRKLQAAMTRLRLARQELRGGRAEVADQEDEVRAMVAATYQQGDPTLLGLSVVFTDQDPAQLAGAMNATSSVVNVESTMLDQLTATRVMLQVKKAEIQAARDEVAVKRQEAADNLVRKQVLEQQAVSAEQQVSDLVDIRTQARQDALDAKQVDLRMLGDLRVEQDRLQRLLAAQTVMGGGYSGPSEGNGYLDWPVTGPITSPFGWRIHPIWGYRSMHDGLDIAAGCGTPVLAPADGTILSTSYSSSLGNRIVMDNKLRYGVGLATAYNHLEGFAVSPGDTVKRGDVIGYVGTTGWSTGCHLHFTVLENGQAQDPMRWF